MNDSRVEPVIKRSLEEQVTDLIRTRIVTGDLALGSRLVEATLAAQYALSRGTIRAALRRLTEEGLVRQEPYTGYRVVDISDHDLWEIYTLRGALESLGARLAAESITEEGAHRLWEAFHALMDASKRDDCTEINRRDHEIHMLIIQLSGNERLLRDYARVENQFRAYIALSNQGYRARDIGVSHYDLVESICAGDATKAARLAEDSVITLPTSHPGAKCDQSSM